MKELQSTPLDKLIKIGGNIVEKTKQDRRYIAGSAVTIALSLATGAEVAGITGKPGLGALAATAEIVIINHILFKSKWLEGKKAENNHPKTSH